MLNMIMSFLLMDNEQLARIIKSGTTTTELDKWGSCISKNYKGTYALDEFYYLPEIKNGAYIINTDPMEFPGTHWLALYKDDGKKRYFDSYGMKPDTIIDEKCQGGIQYLTYAFQNPKNATCGIYYLYFISLCDKFNDDVF